MQEFWLRIVLKDFLNLTFATKDVFPEFIISGFVSCRNDKGGEKTFLRLSGVTEMEGRPFWQL